MSSILFFYILLIILPGIYAYLKGRRFIGREQNDEFALKYFKYRQHVGLVFWLCLISFFILLPVINPRFRFIENFLDYTFGLGTIIVFLIAYLVFLSGYSIIDQTVRDNRVNILKRIKFDLSLLFLISWPYILFALGLFGVDNHYLFRVLVIWILYLILYFYTPAFWKFFFSSKAVEDSALATKCQGITDKASLQPVSMHVFSDTGLKQANAFTVGQWLGAKSIFMTDYAYANLTQNESLSIYAHEVGHLQKHQVLRRSLALSIPVLAIPVVNISLGSDNLFIQWGLFIASLLLIRLIVPSQKFEKEADLFALNATGDASSVISGLEKIYRLGTLPKRFRPSEEMKYTHPSLAQRIKYLRKAAGQEIPKITEPRSFNGMDEVRTLSFLPDRIIIECQNREPEPVPYRDIVAMFPSAVKSGTRLTIRYRDKNKARKIDLSAGYQDVYSVIEIVENEFADMPVVDPAQFKREYLLANVLAMLFGVVSSFFVGPLLFILGVVGFVEKNKNLFLAYFAACLITIAGILFMPNREADINPVMLFINGVFALLSLYNYIRFKTLPPPATGKGYISFYSALVMSVFQAVILVMLIALNPLPEVKYLYGRIFLNFSALALGVLLLRSLKDTKRLILIILNVILLLMITAASV